MASTFPVWNRIDPIVVLLAFVSGLAGAWAYHLILPTRPDPFTGADARQMEQRLIERSDRNLDTGRIWRDSMTSNIEKCESDVERVESGVHDHLTYSLRKTEFYDREMARLQQLVLSHLDLHNRQSEGAVTVR